MIEIYLILIHLGPFQGGEMFKKRKLGKDEIN